MRSREVVRSARDLRVSIEALDTIADHPSDVGRDPFRFSARPAASRQNSVAVAPAIQRVSALPMERMVAPEARMPWKLTLTLQRGAARWAVFSDCRGIPVTVRQGDTLAGTWRVVSVGVESATLRSLDDRVTTLALGGCAER